MLHPWRYPHQSYRWRCQSSVQSMSNVTRFLSSSAARGATPSKAPLIDVLGRLVHFILPIHQRHSSRDLPNPAGCSPSLYPPHNVAHTHYLFATCIHHHSSWTVTQHPTCIARPTRSCVPTPQSSRLHISHREPTRISAYRQQLPV